jgi:hypothetical protein
VKRQIDYEPYLQSAQWSRRRAAWIKRNGPYCRACFKRKGRMELHHLTYVRLGHEHDSDLILLYPVHHERVTVAWKHAQCRLFFRSSLASVTWREIHAVRKERNSRYKPKPKSLGRIAWELIRVSALGLGRFAYRSRALRWVLWRPAACAMRHQSDFCSLRPRHHGLERLDREPHAGHLSGLAALKEDADFIDTYSIGNRGPVVRH